jgi:SAM-dependent methyltransferase
MTTLEFYTLNAEKFKNSFSTLVEFSVPFNEKGSLLASTLNHLIPKINTESSFLDVGCGWGSFSDFLPSSVKYTGIDNCEAMLSYAYPKANATFIKDDLHSLPFEDNSFDYILANESLMYANAENAHREIHRVLKPSGTFYTKMLLAQTTGDAGLEKLNSQPFLRKILNSCLGIEEDINVFGIQSRESYKQELSKFFNYGVEARINYNPDVLNRFSFNSEPTGANTIDWRSGLTEQEIKDFQKELLYIFRPFACSWNGTAFFACTKK